MRQESVWHAFLNEHLKCSRNIFLALRSPSHFETRRVIQLNPVRCQLSSMSRALAALTGWWFRQGESL